MRIVLTHAAALASLLFGLGYAAPAAAQQSTPAKVYPVRPVKIVIPLGPGNSVEIAMRLVADKLTAAMGQPFVIEPQPGAAGQIGTEALGEIACGQPPGRATADDQDCL